VRRAILLLAVLAAVAAPTAPARGTHDCVKGGELWFQSGDGTKLVGHRFGGPKPGGRIAVVLVHQSNGSVCEWLGYSRKLARLGFFAFPFDIRGYGYSEGTQLASRFPSDVAAAVQAVRALGARKVVVVGSSMGGIVSLVAAAAIRPAVDGVVSLSAPGRFAQLNAFRAVPKLTVPVLYAAGRDEPPAAGYDFPGDAQKLYRATASKRKRLVPVPSSAHGIALLESTPSLQRTLEAFLRSA
jgi:pimeloyl-ACP methyl ester carboxylesterase